MDPVAFFREERWTAGVIGLGYVGLPLSATIADRGLRCIGFAVTFTFGTRGVYRRLGPDRPDVVAL